MTDTAVLSPLPTVPITGVELLMPGTYAGVRGGTNTYTTADIDSAVTAFQALRGVFTPKAKLGHNDKQALLAADELPSAGDITNVYRQGDRLVVDVANVPAKLAQLIKAGAYGPRSAELLLNADFGDRGTFPLVLKGFAWLGATPPAVAGLADIVALYSRPEEQAAYQGGTVTEVALAAPHAAMTGDHTHAHPAFGAQGDDATHEHEHAHAGDANHEHPHGDEAQMASAPTKTEGGTAFGKGDYAYTPSDTPSDWKLRLTATPGGAPDAGIVGAAAAALGPGFRGQKVDIPAADRSAVVARVRAAWSKANPDKKDSEMPDALKASTAHSRSPLAALARLLRLAPDVALAAELDQDELTDAQLLAQAIKLIEQFIVREANEQVAGEDEDDDIRGALAARDILQQIAQCELAEAAGVSSDHDDNAGSVAAYYALAEDDHGQGLMTALEAVKAHLDGMGKSRRGVGMARVAHRMLAGYAKAYMAQWQNPDTDGNTDATEGPDGERGKELNGGVPVQHARQEESMQDNELRALLGIDEQTDIKQALLALKGRSVDLAKYDAVVEGFAALERREAEREAELLVDRALTEHKINPAMRDWAVDMARNQRPAFEAYLSAAPATAWPAGELGRAGDAPGAPKPLTPATAQVAQKLGLSLSEITEAQAVPFAERVLAAKREALANAGHSLTRRA